VERWRVKQGVGSITRHIRGRPYVCRSGDEFEARLDEVKGYKDKLEHIETMPPGPGEAKPFTCDDRPDGYVDVYAGGMRLNDKPLTAGDAGALTTNIRSVNWVPPLLWPGRTAVILGGGPSLSDVDHSLWQAGNGNWYSGNPDPAPEDRFSRRFRPGIESTVEPLRQAGVEIINATPGSKLDLPTDTPENVL